MIRATCVLAVGHGRPRRDVGSIEPLARSSPHSGSATVRLRGLRCSSNPSPVALIVECIAALIGFGLMVGTIALGFAYGSQRDDDGYFTTDTVRIESPTAAVRSNQIDLRSDDRPAR